MTGQEWEDKFRKNAGALRAVKNIVQLLHVILNLKRHR